MDAREIVTRAGVTKPVLYYYFKNKGGLFCSIVDSAVELQKTILGEVLETNGRVLDRLIYLYRRMYQGVMEHQNLIHALAGSRPPFQAHEFQPQYTAIGFSLTNKSVPSILPP